MTSQRSMIGQQVGSYQFLSLLGTGGMGEVYRARDTTLGRDVAIKVIPSLFANDADRLAGLAREARLLAALNHPHIAMIHGLEETAGLRALVMELVEGPTLAEKLAQDSRGKRKPGLPLAEALRIGGQIAEALEAAHEKSIIHRDLKPANIKLSHDGKVKVLDFGLAKVFSSESGGSDLSQLATITATELRAGAIVGTPAYMSPEQARGQAIDKRTDIWAFGCVLYELLTGRPAFQGETIADTIAAILEREPEWGALPAHTPVGIRQLLRRCLDKDPNRRLHDIADARIELDDARSAPPAEGRTIPGASGSRDRLVWGLAAALGVMLAGAIGLGAMAYFRRAPASVEATRFFVSPPEGWSLARQTQGDPAVGPLAVAPDGRRVAFVARNASGSTLIWLRSLDTLAAQGLVGTEGAASPFWSPDSRSLGFFSNGKLKKVDVAGGPPVTLCDAAPGISGAWNRAGVIVFSPAGGTALQRVSASGGVPTPATTLAEGETGHSRPAFLPDGRHFVYRALAGAAERTPAFVASLGSAERTRLMDADSTNVLYSQRHLLFLRETTLMAQPFDPDRLALSGEPFPVATQIQTIGGPPFGFFSVSDSGVLAYQTGTATGAPQLTWLDRAGKVLTTVGAPALYGTLALSPDGRGHGPVFTRWSLDRVHLE